MSTDRPLILFDGVCNLCNATVDFVLARDPNARFRFGSLQSTAARSILERCDDSSEAIGPAEEDPATIVLVENGRCYTRSTAALRIARHLSGGWPLLYTAIWIPRTVRDAVYEWIAARRYQWFGKRSSCRAPTPDLADRFLENPAEEEPSAGW